MKTKILLLLASLTAIPSLSFAAKVTITNSGTHFVPNEITVEPGDTIVFTLGSAHNAVEVSQSTWDANGNTSNGGFSLGFGGGQVVLTTPGIHYYVCTPHAALGMKGTITVSGASGIADNASTGTGEIMDVYPNPFYDRLFIHYNLSEPSAVEIDLLDITGKIVSRISQNSAEAGSQSELVDMSFIRPGQYLLRFRSDHENYTGQVVKVQ